MARFTFTDAVLREARRLGAVDGDAMYACQRVQDMLNRSARVTHPLGNRRFGDYVFQVVEGEAVSMGLYHSQVTYARQGVAQLGF